MNTLHLAAIIATAYLTAQIIALLGLGTASAKCQALCVQYRGDVLLIITACIVAYVATR